MTAPVLTVPELGPSLGQLTSRHASGPAVLGLDELRLALVTDLMELASSARDFAESDDLGAAVACVGGKLWLARWDETVAVAAGRVADAINAAFDRAAIESRYPSRQRAALHLDDVERRAIAGRLGAESAPLMAALDALDQAARPASASGERGRTGFVAWTDSLQMTARRLEGAWAALERAAAAELASWQVEIEQVRRWRRPRTPIWVLTAGILLLSTYTGLVLGGYLPVPAPLRPIVQQVWRHL